MLEIPGLKISGPLGAGGTASVAKAYSDELKKDVALKYPLSSDTDTINQFQKLAAREAALIGKAPFPGFVGLLKHSDNPPYLLLELCSGNTLDKLGRIDNVTDLMNIVSSVAASMEIMRLMGIIHGDFKPHNIFLPSDFFENNSGRLFFAKISDFSLGRLISEPESARAGHGTIGYAAPETMSKKTTSHRSDLFALGIIAYQLAAGKHPFMDGESDPVKIESNIQEETPRPLSECRIDLTNEFIALIESLLSKDETKRPETAWTVCETLRKAGATYPFEKVLSPQFILKSQTDFSNVINTYLVLSENEKDWLNTITYSKSEYLRLVLTENYRRRILSYSNGRYRFNSPVYWPSILRRKTLSYFSRANFSTKKKIIKSSVVGNRTAATDLNLYSKEFPPGTMTLFRNFVTHATVKRQSRLLAPKVESLNAFYTAALIYLQAGMLDEAIRCTEKATQNLSDAVERKRAVNLINRIIEHAAILDKEFEVRQLYMVRGDIERDGGDTDSATITYNRLIKLYHGRKSDQLLAETYRDFGDLYKTKQRFEEGIRVLNTAVQIYEEIGDQLGLSKAYNNIGEIYRIASDLPNALLNLRKSLAIQKKLESTADAANTLNNIAITYGMQGRLGRTIILLEISLKIKKTIRNKGEIARTLNNLGLAHQLSGNAEKSTKFLVESLELNREIGSKREMFSNLLNLSESMIKSGNLLEAIGYVKEGHNIAVELNLKPHQADILKITGDIYVKMNRFSDAADCYNRTQNLVEEIDHKVLNIRLHLSLSELHSELGDFDKQISLAKQALEKSVSLKAGLEEFQSLLILVKTFGQSENIQRAKKIAAENSLEREKVLLDLAHIQFLLKNDSNENLQSIFETLKDKKDSLRNDIEYPEMLNTIGEVLIRIGEDHEANAVLTESLKISHSKNLVSEEINARLLLGKVFYKLGNYENAFTSCKNALQLCKQSSSTIDSEKFKKTYMKQPKILLLADQIKKLNEKIGAKK